MFCTQCGAELQEGSKFCTKCGSPVGGNPAADSPVMGNPVDGNVMVGGNAMAGGPVEGNPVPGGAVGSNPMPGNPVISAPVRTPGGKADNKKLFTLVGAIALIAVVIFAISSLFKGCGSSGGVDSPEEAFEAYMDGFSHGDFERMLQTYPDFGIEYWGGREKVLAEVEKNYANQIAQYADQGLEISYRATGYTLLDEDELKELEEGMSEAYGTKVKYSEAATVDYMIIMDFPNGNRETSDQTGGYAVKYKGNWYYFNTF